MCCADTLAQHAGTRSTLFEHVYDDGMSGHEREARQARAAYLGALHRLAQAMTAFNNANVPLEPDGHGRIGAWTAQHVAIMSSCAEAWPAVVARRRAYDATQRPPTY